MADFDVEPAGWILWVLASRPEAASEKRRHAGLGGDWPQEQPAAGPRPRVVLPSLAVGDSQRDRRRDRAHLGEGFGPAGCSVAEAADRPADGFDEFPVGTLRPLARHGYSQGWLRRRTDIGCSSDTRLRPTGEPEQANRNGSTTPYGTQSSSHCGSSPKIVIRWRRPWPAVPPGRRAGLRSGRRPDGMTTTCYKFSRESQRS